jgi:hypothetical protein
LIDILYGFGFVGKRGGGFKTGYRGFVVIREINHFTSHTIPA